MTSLKSCPCSEAYLDRLLESLPQSLDETYERVLCSIEDFLVQDARRVLMFVCYSLQPPSVQEIIEVIAVDLNESMRLETKRRLQDANDIRAICPGLLEFETPLPVAPGKRSEPPKVYIAHFSIKEYLESGRIRHQRAAIFGLASETAHLEIFQILLLYQQELIYPVVMMASIAELDYPLAFYSTTLWADHYEEAGSPVSAASYFILNVFKWLCSSANLNVSLEAHRAAHHDVNLTLCKVKYLVYFAARLGLDTVLRSMLSTTHVDDCTKSGLHVTCAAELWKRIGRIEVEGGREEYDEEDTRDEGEVVSEEEQGGGKEKHKEIQKVYKRKLVYGVEEYRPILWEYNKKGIPLCVASRNGHANVVQYLLDGGVDIHAKIGWGSGPALAQASKGGHIIVVQMLLDRGSVSYSEEELTSALEQAARKDHKDIVLLLLNRGADVNGFGYGRALQFAAAAGHPEMVDLLLSKGAYANSEEGFPNTPTGGCLDEEQDCGAPTSGRRRSGGSSQFKRLWEPTSDSSAGWLYRRSAFAIRKWC